MLGSGDFRMPRSVSRRSLLKAGAAAAAPIPVLASPDRQSARSPVKLGLSTSLQEDLLRFLKQLGVEWIATSLRATQGQTVNESVTRGAVLTAVDGALGG